MDKPIVIDGVVITPSILLELSSLQGLSRDPNSGIYGHTEALECIHNFIIKGAMDADRGDYESLLDLILSVAFIKDCFLRLKVHPDYYHLIDL